MKIRNMGALLAGLALLAAACSSTGSSGGSGGNGLNGATPGGTTNANAYCSAACGKINQCDKSFDTQTCTADCQNQLAPVASKLRGDYLAKVQSCMASQDCASLLAGTADSACSDEAKASLAPSTAGQQLCNDLDASATKCGESFTKSECLDSAKEYDDAALNAARSCTSKSCSDIMSCVYAQLGIQQTSQPSGGNSCEWAYDGVCDEPSVCEAGTDSYDCGA